jgi:hypothetical protein
VNLDKKVKIGFNFDELKCFIGKNGLPGLRGEPGLVAIAFSSGHSFVAFFQVNKEEEVEKVPRGKQVVQALLANPAMMPSTVRVLARNFANNC